MLDVMRAGEKREIEIERDSISDKDAIEGEQKSTKRYKRDRRDYYQDNPRLKYT